ncbi:hypothetical protein GGI05_002517 [Coemansia sp. RSA 2603]|nr:hypothetical protein GGI05_002517 [Coemansia sp. RSA 2603]
MEDSRGVPKESEDGMTTAERLAMDAARDAGWGMRWPQLRMMSQSPDLSGSSSEPTTSSAATPPVTTSSTSIAGAWRQVLRLVSEVTEVFKQPGVAADSNSSGVSGGDDESADADTQIDVDVSIDGDETDEAFPGLAVDHGEHNSFIKSNSSSSSIKGGRGGTEEQSCSAAVRFARRYPLLVLMFAWAVMVLSDWLVTSMLAPHLLALSTRQPWMLSSESVVGRLALASTDPTGLGLWPTLRSGLAKGELWLDARLWRMQELVIGTVAPLTRPYALQWLLFSLVSLHVLRRSSRMGVRAALACVLYFVIADACLWRMLGPVAKVVDVVDVTEEASVASMQTMEPTQAQAPTHTLVAGGLPTEMAMLGVQAPFAEAVALASEQRRQLLERRDARIQRLATWHPSLDQTCGAPLMPLALEFLALLAAYLSVAFHVRSSLGGTRASLRLCVVLFLLDAGVRTWTGASKYTRCLGEASRGAAGLAVHVLGVFMLFVLREMAYAVHSMRVWHGTVVRERRRGPKVLGDGAQGVWLATEKQRGSRRAWAVRSPAAEAVALAGAGGAYAHRVCFLCLSGFCERCLLSLEIWPTAANASLPPSHVESGPQGLPSLRDALPTFGLLGHPSDVTPVSKRGRTLDAWLVCSVARCPCRHVHGVGPSAFASRAARQNQQQLQQQGAVPTTPLGTLLPLAAYVVQLRRLGLVRPVDPATAPGGSDPAAAVLPVVFGRLTAPEHPRAQLAADALLASSAASYAQLLQPSHVSGEAPFLAGGRPSRILVAPTPLALARSSQGSFALCVDALHPSLGSVAVSVVVTPALAHVLLAHPRTSPSAAVCVPAALAGVSSATSAAALAAGAADCDAFLDHVRVLVPRSDVVVRVNGERWSDVESASVGRMVVRGLARDTLHVITLTICGMRSDDLRVYLASGRVVAPGDGAQMRRQMEATRLAAQLGALEEQLAAAQQEAKRARRELPRQVQAWHADCEAARKAVERGAEEAARMRRREELATEHVRRLVAEIEALEQQLSEALTADAAADQAASDEASSAVQQQAQALRERVRLAQAEQTETLRALEDERAQWAETLEQASGRWQPVERSVEPLRRELAEAARRERAARAEENRLRNLLRSLPRVIEKRLVSAEVAQNVQRVRALLEEEQRRVGVLMGARKSE